MAFDACMMRAVLSEISREFPDAKIEKVLEPQMTRLTSLSILEEIPKGSFSTWALTLRASSSPTFQRKIPKWRPFFACSCESILSVPE